MTPSTRQLLAALALGTAAACGGPPNPPAAAPNVLLVSIDTLRADHLGLYGYARSTSPALDAFAESAVVFERCQASASWTLPGMASVFTSTYTSTHGCWGLGARLDDSFTTLTEKLLAHGYDTACVVSHLFCTTRHGLQQGFVHFDDSFAYPEVDPVEATTSHLISDRGIEFLEHKAAADDGRPWLLWLHYFDPHDDYVEQPGFTERFVTEGETPTPVDLYDGEIAYTDHHVGRVLDALDRTGLADDTLVVLVADHGEEFGDHGGVGHGATLFREQIRVPFAIRAPGIAARRVDELVRTIDLLPTVLELTGLPPLAQAEGRSLVAAMRGAELAVAPALAETRMSPLAEQEAYVDGRWKLVRRLADGALRLYDLANDPGETTDLTGAHPEVVARLTAALDALLADARAKGERYETGDAQLTPAALEQLNELGYGGESR